MGAWGYYTFDNDAACDWVNDLERYSDLSLVEQAIALVFDAGYLDAEIGCHALAAIETIARLNGSPGLQSSYTAYLEAWVAAHPQRVPRALVERSKQAIDEVLAPESELAQLWAETDDYQAWVDEVAALRARLSVG